MSWTARKRTVAACLFLAIAAATVYSPSIFHPFVSYDDDGYVTNNLHVRSGLSWNTVTWALTTTEFDNWHPLTWLSHALDCQLYGVKPAGHHLTNVLLHMLNSVLLFLLLAGATRARGRSLLVTALFALHPFNVESVAWVAERKNVLSTLFLLLALGAYGWYARRPKVKRYLVVVACFVLGLAAKPMVITLPFLLLLLDFWPLQRIQGGGGPASQPTPKGRRKRKERSQALEARGAEPPFAVSAAPFSRIVVEKLPLLAFCVASAIITIVAQRSVAIRSLERFPVQARLENALYSYAMYLWKAFWPIHLAAYYPHPRGPLAGWQLGLAAAFLAGISVAVWKQRRTRKYLVTGWLWYLGTLVPVIGLVQVGDQAMADRYAYVPLMGVFLMLVWGIADWADGVQVSLRWRATAASAILAALSYLTWRQVGYWRSDYDLWSHAVQNTEDNTNAEENLSKALAALGRAEEALPGLEKIAQLSPGDPMLHINLGSQLVMVGRLQEALAEYQKAIEVAPEVQVSPSWKQKAMRDIQVRSFESIATISEELADYPRMRESYRQALKIDPHQAPGMIERLSQDAASDPSAPRYLQLGVLLEEVGRVSEARAAYSQALALDPAFKEANQALEALDKK